MEMRPPNNGLFWAVIEACRIATPAYIGMIATQLGIGVGLVIGLYLGDLIH